MKKLTFLLTLLMSVTLADAQQRLVLYEEFSGENCGPCAQANPGLWSLMNTGSNPDKILLLKYQVPIPSAGPIFKQNPQDANLRMSYYVAGGFFDAPNGIMDGIGAPEHPNKLTQTAIDAEAAIPSPFHIDLKSQFSSDKDSIYVTVNITAVSNYEPASGQIKLRAALVETLHFTTPPGTNGETDFHNVVRKLYPNPFGLAIGNSWASGKKQTFTIAGPVPTYVDINNQIFVAVWIQNETDKLVAQAARTSVTTGIDEVVSEQNLIIYPNPVNDKICIELDMRQQSQVSFSMQNIAGQQIGTKVNQILQKGQQKVSLETSHLTKGFYTLSMVTEKGTITRTFVKQ